MNNNITRLDEKSTLQLFYANQTEFFEVSYQNGETSSDGKQVALNTNSRINLEINFDKFHKYSQLRSITVWIKTLESGLSFTLYKKEGLEYVLCREYQTNQYGLCDVDLIDYCNEEQIGTSYFCIGFSKATTVYTVTASSYNDRPRLAVIYIDDLESIVNQKMIEGSAARALNYQVNVRTGRPTYTKSLLSNNTTVMPINLGLYFDPLLAETTDYGMPKGWRFTYNQKITNNNGTYEYIDGRGLRHQFVEAENGNNSVYYDIAGTGLILTKEGTTFKIEDGYNNYLYFNSGKLIKISKKLCYENNINEYGLSFTYSNNKLVNISEVNTIENVTTSTVKVSIDYETEDNEIIISSPGFPNVRLIKDESGYLTQIIEEDNRVNEYTYTSNSSLESAYTDNGEKVVFTYDSRFRINTITDSVVNSSNTNELSNLVLDYKYMSTSITNNFGVKMLYNFNNEGELIGQYEVIDKEGEETTYHNMQCIDKYEDSIKVKEDDSSEYLAFYNTTLTGYTSTIKNTTITSATGDLAIDTKTKYRLSFVYKFSDGEVLSNTGCFVSVLQYSQAIGGADLDFNSSGEMFCNIDFDCLSTDDLSIYISLGHTSKVLYMKNIMITKKSLKEYYFCSSEKFGNVVNYGTEGSPLYPFGKVTFSCNIGTYSNSYMYYQDVIENKRRMLMSESTYHAWYNKKRGLLANINELCLGNKVDFEIEDINFGTISVENGRIYTDYMDYIRVYDSFPIMTSNLGIRYKNVKIDNNTYTLSSEEINKQNQVVKSINYSNLLAPITSEFTYDQYGNIVEEKVGNSSKYMLTSYTYDKKRLLSKTVNINGQANTTTYQINEATGLLESIIYPDGSVETYRYFNDTIAKLEKISKTVGTTVNSNELNYEKDKVTDYIGMNDGLCLEYDKYNQVSKLKNGSNTIWSIERNIDEESYIENIWYGSSSGFHISNNYDKYGNLIIRKESSNGSSYSEVLKYYYTDLEVTDIDSSSPSDVSLDKCSNSKLRRVKDVLINNSRDIYYNNEGKVIKITNTNYVNNPMRIEYEYDNIERLKVINYNFDQRKEITNYLNNYGNEVSGYKTELTYNNVTITPEVVYERDNLNRVIKETIETVNSKKLVREFTYLDTNNQASNLIQKIDYKINTNLVDTLNYEYDIMGRIIKIYDFHNTINMNYTYDTLGRLIEVENQITNKTYTYNYDNNGNILSVIEGINKESTISLTTTKSFTYSTAYTDQLTKYNNQTVYTSASGNIIQIGSTNYTWTRATLLSRVYKSSYVYSDYSYDGSGVRYYKKVYNNGVTVEHYYLCDGNRILTEQIVGGTLSGILNYIYLGNQIVGFTYKNKEYFYQKNLQGDIINIYDNTNTLVASYSYDAWGNHTITLDTNSIGTINPFRYRGYYYDTESNLYYCNARYYNPEILRWMSLDSLEYLDKKRINGCNLYCYANNNPINISYSGFRSNNSKSSINTAISNNLFVFQSKEISILELNFSHFSNMFSYIEDGFSIIEGAIKSYRALNKLSKLEKLDKISKKLKWFGIGLSLIADIENNFTNDELTYLEQCRNFEIDAAYTIGSAAISTLIGKGLSKLIVGAIPGIGPYMLLVEAVAGITASIVIDIVVEESGWLDSLKE